MRKTIYFLFTLFLQLLSAEVSFPELTNPFPIHLISGRLVYFTNRSVSVGPEEISIDCCYVSPKRRGSTRWQIMEKVYIFRHYSRGRKGLLLVDVDGKEDLFIPEDPVSGYESSNKTQFSTQILQYKEDGGKFSIDFSNGVRREYEKINDTSVDPAYRLVKERTLRGNWLVYHYKESIQVTNIEVFGRDLKSRFGEISFKYTGLKRDDPSVIVSKNGLNQFYLFFEKIEGIYTLSYIEGANSTREKFHYQVIKKRKFRKGPILKKIEYPSGSYFGVLWNKDEPIVNSVWGQGSDGNDIELAKFNYQDKNTRIEFCDGRVQDYFFDDFRRIKRVKWGNVEQFRFFDECGRVSLIRTLDEFGNWIEKQMTYDTRGREVQKKLVCKDQEIVEMMQYDDLNRKISQTSSHGEDLAYSYVGDTHLISEQVAGDCIKSYEYDLTGMCIKESESDGGFVKKMHLYHYDNFLLIDEKNLFFNWDSNKFESLSSTKYEYDKKENLVKKELLDRMGNAFFTEKYCYNDRRLVQVLENSNGKSTFFQYDDKQRLKCEKTKDLIVEYEYDRNGRLLKRVRRCHGRDPLIETFQVNHFGLTIFKKDELGKEVTYEHDDLDRAISDENGSWKFDVFGKKAEYVDVIGEKTIFQNGLFTDPISIQYSDGSHESCFASYDGKEKQYTNACGETTICLYDKKDRLVEKSSGDRTIVYSYCGEKLVGVIQNGRKVASYEYDGFGRIKNERKLSSKKDYFYNHFGHLSSIEEDGCLTLFKRDGLGRVLEKWDGLNFTAYNYDVNSEVSEWFRGKGKDVISKKSVYDGFGDLCMEYNPSGEKREWHRKHLKINCIDPMGRQEHEILDKSNRKITCTKESSGQVTQMKYDPFGNLIEKSVQVNGEEKRVSYKYDKKDRAVEIVDQYGRFEKEYDEIGNLIWERKPSGIEVFYKYNRHSELIQIKTSDGLISYQYEYDVFGDVIKTKNLNTNKCGFREYNTNREMVREGLENGLVVEYGYEKNKKCLIGLPDQSSIHYVFNQDKVSRVYRKNANQEFLYDYLYLFDTRGMPQRETMIGELGTIDKQYSRDLQLSMISSPFHFQKVTKKDSVGNVLEVRFDEGENHYVVDGLDQIVLSGKKQPIRAACGRVTQVEGAKLFYDGFDRLVKVEGIKGDVIFEYDAFNRLISKVANKKRSRFLYDEFIEIGRVNEEGEIEELRVLGYGKEGDLGRAVAVELFGFVYAPLHDLFGNISALVDMKKKKVVGRYTSSVFGADEKISGVISPWRFGSKRKDETSKIVHYGFRAYLPEYREFCQIDARGDGNDLDLTHFNYNNPLTRCDPWGLDSGLFSSSNWSVSFDNYFLAPQFPYNAWIAESARSRESIFVPNQNDIRDYPGRESCSKDQAVVIVNGIRNREDDCKKLADKVAQKYSGKIVSIYNRSGGLFHDLQRVVNEFAKVDTAPVLNLRNALYDLHEKGFQNIHLINHSEGGLIAKRALEKLSFEVCQKVNVISLASPTRIPNCYAKSSVHYYSRQDTVDKFAAMVYLSDLAKGHKTTIKYHHGKVKKFGEHSITCPTYSFILDQVLESIENAS